MTVNTFMKTSYSADDVIFLLKDLSDIELEKDTFAREQLIQQGVHYSTMLPKEFQPSEAYIELFHKTLAQYSKRIADAVAVVAEMIVAHKSIDRVVLVSLARAGTPIGILIKRYLEQKYKRTVPHYAISIVRDRGIDEVAIRYMLAQHPEAELQFVDGWTGKGAITRELTEACKGLKQQGIELDDTLAVLADPGHCSSMYGTRDDFLIPSACLNSTVSGLVSRTVLNDDWIHEGDFHGAKYYAHLVDQDVSNLYIDTIAQHFSETTPDDLTTEPVTWLGMQSVERIQKKFNIQNTHHIKPGVGETTRVLLRRVPWKILVNPAHDADLQHIYMLAEERGVPVEVYTDMSYSCCGLIKEITE